MEDNIKVSESKEIMDVMEVARYLGIGKSKIYNLIRTKKIPASKIGRQYRFSKDVIDSWLKEKLITEGPSFQYDLFKVAKEPVLEEKKL